MCPLAAPFMVVTGSKPWRTGTKIASMSDPPTQMFIAQKMAPTCHSCFHLVSRRFIDRWKALTSLGSCHC